MKSLKTRDNLIVLLELVAKELTPEGIGRELGVSANSVCQRFLKYGTNYRSVRKLLRSGVKPVQIADQIVPDAVAPVQEAPDLASINKKLDRIQEDMDALKRIWLPA